jgi:stearoyl-CoA desaturase (delta-9 desaturase)
MALAAGAMAVPSRPIDWAARHLEHHAHADREGDPHSPLDGLLHAHVGWMFGVSAAKRERYCRRLMRDPVVMLIERTALVWLALGLAVPALIDGWRGLLWGGIVRMAIHNHAMFGVNSICHAFGSQPFATGDESRNNRLIAVLAFGEGWHNNHHAFPAMAYHGMGSRPDATGLVIRGLERAGLAWDVNRPDPAAVARRRTLEITGSTRPQPRRSHASASLAPAATPASARRPRSPSARTETVPGRRFRCSGWCRWCRNPARTVRRRLRRAGARPG